MAKQLVSKASNVSDGTLQKHIRAITNLRVTLDAANGEYRAALKAAKKEGVNTGQLIAAMGAKRREHEDVLNDLKQYVRYLGLLQMPVVQLDLFNLSNAPEPSSASSGDAGGDGQDGDEAETASPEEHALWQANQAGLTAGGDGQDMGRNPHDAGSDLNNAWHAGWEKGKKSLNVRPGVKKASLRRNRASAAAGGRIN